MRTRFEFLTLLTILLGACLALPAIEAVAGSATYPAEVGPIAWPRDFEAGLAESKLSGKPVFAFFQEVPGCSGCKKFGTEVMSHPTIIQAIQHEFVPLLVYNNRGGRDAALLERYGEPGRRST